MNKIDYFFEEYMLCDSAIGRQQVITLASKVLCDRDMLSLFDKIYISL